MDVNIIGLSATSFPSKQYIVGNVCYFTPAVIYWDGYILGCLDTVMLLCTCTVCNDECNFSVKLHHVLLVNGCYYL